jgi:hypothetical protein
LVEFLFSGRLVKSCLQMIINFFFIQLLIQLLLPPELSWQKQLSDNFCNVKDSSGLASHHFSYLLSYFSYFSPYFSSGLASHHFLESKQTNKIWLTF